MHHNFMRVSILSFIIEMLCLNFRILYKLKENSCSLTIYRAVHCFEFLIDPDPATALELEWPTNPNTESGCSGGRIRIQFSFLGCRVGLKPIRT